MPAVRPNNLEHSCEQYNVVIVTSRVFYGDFCCIRDACSFWVIKQRGVNMGKLRVVLCLAFAGINYLVSFVFPILTMRFCFSLRLSCGPEMESRFCVREL